MPQTDDLPSADNAAAQPDANPFGAIDLSAPTWSPPPGAGPVDLSGLSPDLGQRVGQAMQAIVADPSRTVPIAPSLKSLTDLLRAPPPETLQWGLLGSPESWMAPFQSDPDGEGQDLSIKAGIAWLTSKKAYLHDSNGTPRFAGWLTGISRYNGGGDPGYLAKVNGYLAQFKAGK
jgi:hypothetical protein